MRFSANSSNNRNLKNGNRKESRTPKLASGKIAYIVTFEVLLYFQLPISINNNCVGAQYASYKSFDTLREQNQLVLTHFEH